MTLERCDLFGALDDRQRWLLERRSRKGVVERRRPSDGPLRRPRMGREPPSGLSGGFALRSPLTRRPSG